MTAYLKYYFGFDKDKDRLYLDSVSVSSETELIMPNNFLKWYEDGDIDFSFNMNKNIESSVYSSVFSPKIITFSVKDYCKE